jgi:very-short-patch-repair endonuclease
MISKSSKDKILKRLKQENARSPYMNSLPGKFKSFSKVDLGYLISFNPSIKKKIVPAITNASSFTYYHNQREADKSLGEDLYLQKGLATILDRSKVIRQETGSESLAVGFPMLIERSAGSTTDCKVIPLFIWSLELTQEKISTRWKFNFNADVPRVNPSLKGFIDSEKIPLDLRPLYQQIEAEEFDEFGFNDYSKLIQAFQTVNSGTLKRIIQDVEELEFIPFESKTEMRVASDPGIAFELYNAALLTTYRESKFSIIKDFEHLGDSIPDIGKAKAKVSEIPANSLDPSQFGVLEDINALNHVVLHGPPGTGKSQTITGVITAGLANRLKIAVVCQKAAAIDVLIENLAELGLQKETIRITNVSADRKAVVEKARGLDEHRGISGLGAHKRQTLADFEKVGSEVVNGYLAAQEKVLWEGHTWNQSVGKISKFKRQFPELDQFDYDVSGARWLSNTNEYRNVAVKLDELYTELDQVQDVLEHLNQDAEIEDVFDEINQLKLALDVLNEIPEAKLKKLLEEIRLAQTKEHSSLISQRSEVIQSLDEFARLQAAYDVILLGSKYLEFAVQIPYRYADLTDKINQISELQNTVKALTEEFITFEQSDLYKKYAQVNGVMSFIYSFSSRFKEFNSEREAFNNRARAFGISLDIPALKDCYKNLGGAKQLFSEALTIAEKYPDGAGIKLQEIKGLIATIESDISLDSSFSYVLDDFTTQVNEYQSLFDKRQSSLDFLSSSNRITNSGFASKAIEKPNDALKIAEAIELKGLHLDGAFELFRTNKKFNGMLPLHSRSCPFLLELEFGILQAATKKYYKQHETSLPRTRFSAKFDKQKELVETITAESRKVAKYQSSVRRVEALDLIKSKASSIAKVFALRGKTKKSLRQIAQQYPNELTELFPVFMMTPEVACNLFEGNRGLFDIVIVDEASQVELHDILPVLFKGKTIVVAGDQHQMPPSNFFSSQLDVEQEEEEDDMEELIEVESLLEFCQTHKKFKSRYLDFHYRSNHEALISFSNDAIYKRLVVKPTNEWSYSPYYFSRVYNGLWLNNKNKQEAERVVNHLKELEIGKSDVPRILVATLNAVHRKEVQDHIVQASSEDAGFESKMSLLYRYGFGVKNLENLQGDECDLLIISTGYGPGLDNKFRQNLGVLNQEKGYRLLNVLITRAKFKVILVTSIPKQAYKEYVDILKAGKFGRGLLYAYISFVEAFTEGDSQSIKNIRHLLREHGIQTVAQDSGNGTGVLESPFEEEVYTFLSNHFNQDEIVLQEAHSSGFRIDMVLRPKKKPGLRIAIECDGASFHSGWKNQTLDIHRQRLLENAGYHFVRIWSTDWWRSQKVSEKMILDQIQKIVNSHSAQVVSESSWLKLDWEDERPSLVNSGQDFLVLEEPTANESLAPVVSTDCFVKLEVLNKTMDPLVFWIVSNQGKVKEGIKCLPHTDRLPQALLGKSIGDVVDFNSYQYKIAELLEE